MRMNLSRILLAAVGGFRGVFVIGGVAFGVMPWLRNEFLKYPACTDAGRNQKRYAAGMAFMFVAMVVLTVIYAMLYRGGSGLWKARGLVR